MKHRASPRFWRHYRALPDELQQSADRGYALLLRDPRHPSLHFKRTGRLWSVRVGLHHRPLTVERGGEIVWIWIGSQAMPELSRFYGIIIRMYCELGPHHSPHFHAYHGDDEAVYGLDPIELLAGSLPRRQARLVEAWAELHQSELVADWGRLQAGSEPLPIEPLP